MKLFSYVVRHDTGFAPNPFFGYCTLACCKPEIRRTAKPGDWLVGLTPKDDGNRIVYFMQVDEKLEFKQYWSDPRFRRKRPRANAGLVRKNGDNIYKPLAGPGDRYRQLRSRHSKGACEDSARKKHDLRGKYVLVSETFAYFGARARKLPRKLSALAVGRGHRCRFPDCVIALFLEYAKTFDFRVHAPPGRWPSDDQTWKEACARSHREPGA
ncbi:MAG: hypothetical protein ABSH05_01985 [Bryobacteraceae bacterium]|jgi:hypothetical protein